MEGSRLGRHGVALSGLLLPWSLPKLCGRPLIHVLCIGCYNELVLMVSPSDVIKLWLGSMGCAVVIF